MTDRSNGRRLLVVAGPTASGKTALAVELAQRLEGEVLSADSMQVYRDLSIGTARPDEEEMGGIPHHLMGFLPLSARYSVAQYAADARRVMEEVFARGRQPILCGGTGLYIQALTDNIAFAGEEEAPPCRERLREEAAQQGGEEMLRRLAQVDAATAAKLHPHDMGRIVRALEVYERTGVPLSEWNRRSKETPPPYEVRMITLDFHDRARLYDRIDRRVDEMLQRGLLEEARRALSCDDAPTAMQAIGYKELAPYFAGELPLQTAVENLKRGTRRYAKRQLSWFRHVERAVVLYVDAYETPGALTQAALTALTSD